MSAFALVAPVATTPTAADPVVALLTRGDYHAAVALAARQHGSLLGRVCMAMLGSRADADEAVQETLLAAHRSMSTFRVEASFRAWLCGIARHVCSRRLELRRRDVRLLASVPAEPAAPDAMEARDRARLVRAALGKLRPSEREPLILRYVADLDYAEVAAALDLDEPAARKRVSRALARLREVFPMAEQL